MRSIILILMLFSMSASAREGIPSQFDNPQALPVGPRATQPIKPSVRVVKPQVAPMQHRLEAKKTVKAGTQKKADGTLVRTMRDGTKMIESPDHSKAVQYPNGRLVLTTPGGSTLISSPSGNLMIKESTQDRAQREASAMQLNKNKPDQEEDAATGNE